MARIERLPEDLVNKIAAGEVVERPASVVKELLENAVDAGATAVHVDVEAGGKSLVRVRDDGHGMERADAERALERHATSKLRDLSDLQAIATHGFRGEALPSIASVSHLVLRTRDDSSSAGTEVEVRHGRAVHVREAGHPRGTTVEVRDLFGGVPARRKFLRADSTEAGHVAEAVTLAALARPGTGFFLTSGGRPVLRAPPVNGLGPRLFQVFGSSILDGLVPVDGGEDWAHVSGFVSRPDRRGPSRPSLRLFVNGRPVRDRAITRAVAEAYRAATGGERPFEAFLFVEAPLHMVDVNVHPAKIEVRFADPRTVWAAVQSAVRQALSAGARVAPRADAGRVEEAVERYLAGAPGTAGAGQYWRESEGARASGDERSVAGAGWGRALVGLDSAALPFASAPATVLGQHRNTYIVATDGEDLLLVDQHTAHERVRFEAIVDGLERAAVESQRLLAPLVVDLPPRVRPLLEEHAGALAALGFDAEPFGAGSVRVRAVPALLGTRDPGPALSRILQELLDREDADWSVSGSRDRMAATLACHSAVRAGEPLRAETMVAIVRDLATTAHPTLCPHGRPTSVRIPREDVSRWFGRSGWRRQ